jgi:hypothetical protein
MTLEESFYTAWLDTRTKALDIFSSHAYFPEDTDIQKYQNCIEYIRDGIHKLFTEAVQGLTRIDSTVVTNCFEHIRLGIRNIKSEIASDYVNETWFDFPMSILNNIDSYLLDNFSKKFNDDAEPSKKNTVFDSWGTWFSGKKKESTPAVSEDTFKELTELHINQMLIEFNIASFQIMDNYTWHENFFNVQQVYKAIKQSHKRNGLPCLNLGADKRLNIIMSEKFLNERKWLGIQSKTNASFSIFINPVPSDIQITWAHEYTHFLDRLAAHIYYQQNDVEEEISSFSHLALNAVVNQTPISNKALKIMAETMSAAIGGVSAEEFGQKMKNTIDIVKKDITLKIIVEALPEKDKTWNALTNTEKQILINKCRISELTDFIMVEISNYPNATFGLSEVDTVMSIEGEKKVYSKFFVPDIIANIIEKVPSLDQFSMHANLLEYLKEDLASDVKLIMNQHNLVIYKDHSVYNDRFFLSPGNVITQTAQNKNIAKYQVLDYDKPLELLARMSENLQFPLLDNYEYNNLENKDKSNFMNPILGKEERMMLCAALHGMATYAGIQILETDLEELPCVIPDNVDISLDLPINNPADFIYANPNQIVPDEAHRKLILQNIEKIKEKLNEPSKVFQRKE